MMQVLTVVKNWAVHPTSSLQHVIIQIWFADKFGVLKRLIQ